MVAGCIDVGLSLLSPWNIDFPVLACGNSLYSLPSRFEFQKREWRTEGWHGVLTRGFC